MNSLSTRISAAAVASLAIPAIGQAQIGTAFPYQGALRQAGAAVQGTADFQFRLFTSPGGSVQVGATQSKDAVQLDGGRFNVLLDFGPGAFNGSDRYLEVAVRSPTNTGNFVILTPRQRVSPLPYAFVPGIDGRSLNAEDGSPMDAVFVNDTGGVGIGTTTPNGVLDVRSGSNSHVRVDSLHGDLHTNGGLDKVAGIYNDSTGVDARTDFLVNNWPHMVINGGGGVGIGTLNPLRRFTVVDSGIFTARFETTSPVRSSVDFLNGQFFGPGWELRIAGVTDPDASAPGFLYFQHRDPLGEELTGLSIAPNSWIGLGHVNPGFRLDLPNIGSPSGRGRANAWTTYSSARWKHNVKTIESALDTVEQLRGVSFDWKPEHGGTHDIGFVAEEVGRVVPEIVSWEKDGAWAQGLAYDRVTALAVEAIKEQQGALGTLRRSNAALTEQIEKLERFLASREDGAARE